ncbi:MMPL family transporter [Mycobacterium sp. ENV421]|uniref:MMPL family transporter n=1 Tax=Mycobacterium sp. ENV421 TaxID=1213407 RepID=UPI001E3134A6|nr:MMPL family transporter [Mycobacterium sp. ENV421]
MHQADSVTPLMPSSSAIWVIVAPSVSRYSGATTAVFQWGWCQQLLGIHATTPVLSLLPIIVSGVLYGLAMDYEVFLVSSIKEAHTHGHHGNDAVAHGFKQASRVVVAAAIIMICVFAGFAFNPDPMITQVGFALTRIFRGMSPVGVCR